MDQGPPPAATAAETFGQHTDQRGKILALQRAIGPCAARQREELFLAPFSRADFGNDLLRQHVERLIRHCQAVELAAVDAVDDRRALDKIVARERKQPARSR